MVATDVLQAKVGGLSKHKLTLPTKGILKILTLLVSRKQNFPKEPMSSARTMTESARLGLFAVSTSYLMVMVSVLMSKHSLYLPFFKEEMSTLLSYPVLITVSCFKSLKSVCLLKLIVFSSRTNSMSGSFV